MAKYVIKWYEREQRTSPSFLSALSPPVPEAYDDRGFGGSGTKISTAEPKNKRKLCGQMTHKQQNFQRWSGVGQIC